MTRLATALLICVSAAWLCAQGRNVKPLQVYVIDAEGGKAALYISPSGQSVLVDSGSAGGRDTDRLMPAIADAGVKQIDFLISTHYHSDHVGGLQELSKRIPIAHFVDHGPTVETAREQVAGFQQMYKELYGKAAHTVAKAGDRLPVTGLEWRIVTSAGEGIKAPLSGRATPNPICASFKPTIEASTWGTPDDDQSVGSIVTLGSFRMLDFGDLLWDHAMALTCPNNLIGTVDLYMVTGHGAEVCSAAPFVEAIRPRVAIMQNGTRKGGDLLTMQTLRSSPGFQDLWQLHWAYKGGLEQNSPAALVANIEDTATIAGVLVPPPPAPRAAATAPAPGAAGQAGRGRANAPPPHVPAYWIKISAWPDGSFTVSNTRNGFSRSYAPAAHR
jgi:beta-lactamase superfamily II metal-dependent hydrolase